MSEIHKKLFGTKMDYNDYDFYYMSMNPTVPKKERNIIKKISYVDEDGIRDKVISKNIIKKLKEGYSVLVVYGQTHVAVIEPVLRNYFK